jgi:hypothetical protein
MHKLLAIACLLLGTGCALIPQPGPRPTVGPPYLPPPDPVWVVIDPALLAASAPASADSSEARTPTPGPDERHTGAAPARSLNSETRGALTPGLGAEEAGPDSARAMADSVHVVASRAALVSIDLDPEDQARLTRVARRNLAAADSLTRLAGARALSSRNPAKLAAAQGLVRQAQEAMLRGDIRAAANLAYKARLLAAEAQQ